MLLKKFDLYDNLKKKKKKINVSVFAHILIVYNYATLKFQE